MAGEQVGAGQQPPAYVSLDSESLEVMAQNSATTYIICVWPNESRQASLLGNEEIGG